MGEESLVKKCGGVKGGMVLIADESIGLDVEMGELEGFVARWCGAANRMD